MTAFCWMEWAGKTPRDLGLSWDEVDPWYHDAMLLIKGGFARGQKKKLDEARR